MLRSIVAGMVSAVALAASANADGLKDFGAPPQSTWAGSYAGVYGGYGWGESNVTSQTNSTTIPWPTTQGAYLNPSTVYNALTTVSSFNNGVAFIQPYQQYTYNPGQAAINKAESPSLQMDGLDIGGEAGHNFQTGNWVFGFEGSFGAYHITDTATANTPTVAFSAFPAFSGFSTTTPIPVILNQNTVTSVTTVDTDWLATLRARLGFTTGRALFYGTAGVAFTSVNLQQKNSYVNGGTSLTQGGTTTAPTLAAAAVFTNFGSENTSSNSVETGYAVGGGVEYKIGGNWTGKLEYLYLGFGDINTSGTVYSPTGTAIATVHHSADLDANVVHAGLNYHFGNGYQPLP